MSFDKLFDGSDAHELPAIMTATVSFEEALTHIAAIVEFAYQHGFHELGYDPVDVIRRATAPSGAKAPTFLVSDAASATKSTK